jgi:hypothetical protein
MKAVILLLVLVNSAFGQAAEPPKKGSGLRVEVRTSSPHVRITDDVTVTVFFRSPEKEVTIWNFLEWAPAAGIYLRVVDSTGKEVPSDFAPFIHPIPPDLTGKDALISIGGNVFAGFETRIAAKTLFPKPGQYTIWCLYSPPLSRDYFRGHAIWGKEDGPADSVPATVVVDE